MENNCHSIAALIAAEEPIVRYGLRRLLETEEDLHVVGEASDSAEIVRMTRELAPDVVLLDLALSHFGMNILSDLASSDLPGRTIALVPENDASQFREAFRRGVRGVLLKNSVTQVLLNSVRRVVAGEFWVAEKGVTTMDDVHTLLSDSNGRRYRPDYGLTPRELEIVGTIVNGYSNKETGQKFSITERTVKHHLSNIFDKLGVSSRLELAIFAVNHHLEGDGGSRRFGLSERASQQPEYQEA